MINSRYLSMSIDSVSHLRPIHGPSSTLSPLMTVPTPTSPLVTPLQGILPFTILKTLCEKVDGLPKSVPIAKKTGPLAGILLRFCGTHKGHHSRRGCLGNMGPKTKCPHLAQHPRYLSPHRTG